MINCFQLQAFRFRPPQLAIAIFNRHCPEHPTPLSVKYRRILGEQNEDVKSHFSILANLALWNKKNKAPNGSADDQGNREATTVLLPEEY
jgi:hypothetical protein